MFLKTIMHVNASIEMFPSEFELAWKFVHSRSRLTMRINDIQRRCNSTNDHPSDLERKEEVRPEPAIPRRILRGNSKAVEPCTSQDELWNNKQQPELRLIDAYISPRQPIRSGIGKKATEYKPNNSTSKCSRVHVTRFHLVEEEWWP